MHVQCCAWFGEPPAIGARPSVMRPSGSGFPERDIANYPLSYNAVFENIQLEKLAQCTARAFFWNTDRLSCCSLDSWGSSSLTVAAGHDT